MYRRFFKRFLDLVFALAALPFFLIVLGVIGPVIYLEDRGPILYCGQRLGKDGRVFWMYKLRSMKTDAPDIRNEDGSTFNSADDPRVTRIGRFIRKTSIDETPQILNILRGDMSLVGPRPDLPDAVRIYERNERRKLDVRPGITGYSQVFGRNRTPLRKRFEQDVYYADHLSLLLDLGILVKTVRTVVLRKNVYRNKTEVLCE